MANPRSMLGSEDEELPVEVPGVKGLWTERRGGGVVLLVRGFWRAAARNWVSCGTAEAGASLVHSGPSPLTWEMNRLEIEMEILKEKSYFEYFGGFEEGGQLRFGEGDLPRVDELEHEVHILVGYVAQDDLDVGRGDFQEDLAEVVGAGREDDTVGLEAPALAPELSVHQVTAAPQRF